MSFEQLVNTLYQKESAVVKPRVKRSMKLPSNFLSHTHVSRRYLFVGAALLLIAFFLHAGYQAIPRQFPLQIKAGKPIGQNSLATFALSEKPQFLIQKPQMNRLLASVVKVVAGRRGDGLSVKLITPAKREISFTADISSLAEKNKTILFKKAFAQSDQTTKAIGDIVLTQGKDGLGLALPALDDLSGAPGGRYIAEVTWVKDGITYNSNYAFSWGVLVLNTDRDRYEVGDVVRVGAGMVDDRGYTVCEGDVTATITDPTGKKVTLKTPKKGGKSGKLTEEQAASLAFITGGDSSFIATSPDCGPHSITDNPDYSFQFSVPKNGTYIIKLSATTEHGAETVEQKIAVSQENEIAIARTAAMRIYPLADYTMKISLRAKNGYTGKVVETVPDEFGITCDSCIEVKNQPAGRQGGKTKTLTWDVSLSPNSPETLTYTYNPPDISPALFSVGPLSISEPNGTIHKITQNLSPHGSVSGSDGFRVEQRSWAIAFDAVVPQVTLTQRHYIFEDDDGANVNSNTDIAAADTAITSVRRGERIEARFQVDNTSANTFFNPQFELFYDRSDNIWNRVEASGSAAVTSAGNCTGTNWNCSIVDSSSTIMGQYTSIAVDPSGKAWVSYKDGTNGGLKVAKYVGSGGNCSSTAWNCTVVDNASAAMGEWSSIAFTSSGSAWISYLDGTNANLKVAKYVGSGGNCTSSAWTCTIVDSSVAIVGTYSSIAVDQSDNAWISYKDGSNADLKVATYVTSGGNCTSAAWNCTTVDSLSANEATYTSIAIDPSGNAWVSYQDQTNGDLKVATYVTSGGNCSSAAWNCTTVDSSSSLMGTYSGIAIDPSGIAWVSYYDATNGDLKVATYVTSGGNCSSAAWNCSIVDSSLTQVGSYTHIAFGPSGNAWVSYYSLTTGYLKVATYVGSGGSCSTGVWSCSIVDSSAVIIGEWSSIALDPSGNAWVSYHDSSNGDLKVATIKRGGEILPGYGRSGATGDALTANVAGSCTGGTSFVTGVWTQGVNLASSSAKLGNLAANKCTEISFMIDTSRAIAGTTYRLRLHNKSPGYDIGLNTYSQNPTFTIVTSGNDTFSASKDVQFAMANCTDTTWGCANVTSSTQNLVMQQHSIAFDASGSAWISSFDNWNADLVVTRYVGSGGTGCGTGVLAWTCQTVDHSATNSKGEMNSIGIDPKGKVYVAYYDRVNGDLEVAEYVGTGGSGCKAGVTDWLCYSVDSTGDTGGYTSIAFDKNGNPWISEFEGTQKLRLARYVGSGGTGCALTSWTCVNVDTGSTMGRYTTLRFDQNWNPWISYTEQTSNQIRIAQYIGSGGGSAAGCGTGSSTEWRCETIDDATNITGRNTSLAIDNNNVPWVAFYEDTGFNLWVAKYVGTGGTGCTSSTYSGKWSCTKVEDTNSVGQYNYIAIGPDNKPWISYYDATNTSLRLAKYVGGAAGTGCGGGSTDWTCAQIDNTSTTTGQWTAMAFDPSGVPWIAETDATAANTELHVAKLHYPYYDNMLRYKLDNLGYTYVMTDDTNFDQMAATTNTPIYRWSKRYASNTSLPGWKWIGKSSVAASTNNILLQVYRFGSTNAWETLATEASCSANTDCTIVGGTPVGTASEYFRADPDGSNYWIQSRVYQVAGTTKIFQTDLVDTILPPTKIVFSTPSNAVSSGVCSGASVPFAITLQDNNSNTQPPTGSTVVQVTSNSSSYTIYSDSGCVTPVSGGNFTFTTSEVSKTFYLVDSVRGTHVLTATKISGPETLTAATQYQNTLTASGDTDSSAIMGGVNLRGGSTIR